MAGNLDPTVWADTDAQDDGELTLPQPLVTLGDVKVYLNYNDPTAPTTDDAALLQQLTAASDYIERTIGPISPTGYVERFDGWDGDPELPLMHSPVLSVQSVIEQWSTGGAHNLQESVFGPGSDGYQLQGEYGYLVRVFQGNWPRTWYPGSLNVQVTYTAGYDPVPPILQQACVELVAHWWTQGHQAAQSFSASAENGYDAVDAAPGSMALVPYRVADKLKLFRKPVLG